MKVFATFSTLFMTMISVPSLPLQAGIQRCPPDTKIVTSVINGRSEKKCEKIIHKCTFYSRQCSDISSCHLTPSFCSCILSSNCFQDGGQPCESSYECLSDQSEMIYNQENTQKIEKKIDSFLTEVRSKEDETSFKALEKSENKKLSFEYSENLFKSNQGNSFSNKNNETEIKNKNNSGYNHFLDDMSTTGTRLKSKTDSLFSMDSFNSLRHNVNTVSTTRAPPSTPLKSKVDYLLPINSLNGGSRLDGNTDTSTPLKSKVDYLVPSNSLNDSRLDGNTDTSTPLKSKVDYLLPINSLNDSRLDGNTDTSTSFKSKVDYLVPINSLNGSRLDGNTDTSTPFKSKVDYLVPINSLNGSRLDGNTDTSTLLKSNFDYLLPINSLNGSRLDGNTDTSTPLKSKVDSLVPINSLNGSRLDGNTDTSTLLKSKVDYLVPINSLNGSRLGGNTETNTLLKSKVDSLAPSNYFNTSFLNISTGSSTTPNTSLKSKVETQAPLQSTAFLSRNSLEETNCSRNCRTYSCKNTRMENCDTRTFSETAEVCFTVTNERCKILQIGGGNTKRDSCTRKNITACSTFHELVSFPKDYSSCTLVPKIHCSFLFDSSTLNCSQSTETLCASYSSLQYSTREIKEKCKTEEVDFCNYGETERDLMDCESENEELCAESITHNLLPNQCIEEKKPFCSFKCSC